MPDHVGACAGHRRAARPALSGAAWLEAHHDVYREDGVVTALLSKDEAQAYEIDELVEKKFEGSLPAFIAAFTKRQNLSSDELDEVQQMIDRIRRGQ